MYDVVGKRVDYYTHGAAAPCDSDLRLILWAVDSYTVSIRSYIFSLASLVANSWLAS